jgi:nucleoside phosphorylase/tetratricopeptide (TPR) repeat protein
LDWHLADLAQKTAKNITEVNPKCPRALAQLGRSYQLQHNDKLALLYLNDAMQKSEAADSRPGTHINVEHTYLLAAAHAENRQDIIDSYLGRWRAEKNLASSSRFFFAICLFELEVYQEAENLLNALLSDKSERSGEISIDAIQYELGMCAQALGKTDLARKHYLDALESNPTDSHHSYNALALLESHLGNDDAAVSWARRACEKAPEQYAYKVNLAAALASAEKFSEAAGEYESVLREIDSPAIYFSWAIALLEAGEHDKSIAALEKLEKDKWKLETISINVGVALARRRKPGDLEQALGRHKRALEEVTEGIRHAILIINIINILSALSNVREAREFAKIEPPASWPNSAKQELLKIRTQLNEKYKSQLREETIRLFGNDSFQTIPQTHIHVHAAQGSTVHISLDEQDYSMYVGTKSTPIIPPQRSPALERKERLKNSATIGIITALEKEYIAMEAMLEIPVSFIAPGIGAGRRYLLGEIPALDGGFHVVALGLLIDAGNNLASIRATQLMQHFPTVKDIIMCGIAGGLPNTTDVNEDVRLGDIVVSNQNGIVQYDLVKRLSADEIEVRQPPRPPSAELLEADRVLRANSLKGQRPWEQLIQRGKDIDTAKRPDDNVDAKGNSIIYPNNDGRRPRFPRVFTGPIASANTLLRDAAFRDSIRKQYRVKAVEMESSGIADATWIAGLAGYLAIRGICDYCDNNKGDQWHGYAALAAAAYVRALLESIPIG